MAKRISPIVAMGRKFRKKREQEKKTEAKRLVRFKRMEIKAKRREQKAIAKEVAKIRKEERLYE